MSNETVLVVAAAAVRPLFGLDRQTLIHICIQLFNACVLGLALRFILYKPVSGFMQRRAESIKSQMRIAEEEIAKAEEMRAQYEQMLLDLEQEKIDILETAITQATQTSEKMISDARNEIDEMKRLAQSEIRLEREQADDEMRQYVIDIASYLAEKILLHSIDEDTQNRLFEESLSELESVL
ncbi:MAG: ATP synthase F0 subunit B [Oscillospiraceae bacterium]|nr:ATP synthase F0 subunit B [Oscillospiraceae bacterium]